MVLSFGDASKVGAPFKVNEGHIAQNYIEHIDLKCREAHSRHERLQFQLVQTAVAASDIETEGRPVSAKGQEEVRRCRRRSTTS